MNLFPYRAMIDADNIRREIDRIYRLPFPIFAEKFADHENSPPLDVYETDEQIIVSCDLPGLQRKEDVNISIEDRELTISGTVNREQQVIQEDRMHRKERYSGSFRRTITLPQSVADENVRAIYKNGVLNIFFPKSTASTNKSIDVKFDH
ncbi:MAG: Hsp20/alpha crystallin family protein [Desulfitobacteriia bacterium]|jgi:HSP20 family protein